MQLAEPADRYALDDDARRAIGMQPLGREAGVGREAVEVDGTRLEPRQHLLHHALHIVEIDGPRGVQCALLRKTAHCAKADRRALFHLLRRSAEDRAQLEQPHIAYIAMQIAGNHGRACPAPATAAARRLLRSSGLPSGTTSPGCGAVKAASAAEQKVLAIASWNPADKQSAADSGFALGPGQRLHAFAEGGQSIGEAVVAVNARDFFDQIDLALQVEPPTGQRHLPRSHRPR